MIINDQHNSVQGNILVADDDLFYRRLLANFLIGEKFSVTSVATTEEARNRCLTDTFDLCVFDYYLPGEPLESVIDSLKRSGRNTPFIIITGDESCDTEREARGFGPVFFFVKPFSLSDFASVIKESINRFSQPVSVPENWSVEHE